MLTLRDQGMIGQAFLKESRMMTIVYSMYSKFSGFCRYRTAFRVRTRSAGLMGLALLPLAAPASASPVLACLPMGALSAAAASVPPTSSCSQITYDQSGNRLARTSSAVVTGAATWGSATYGCSAWS